MFFNYLKKLKFVNFKLKINYLIKNSLKILPLDTFLTILSHFNDNSFLKMPRDDLMQHKPSMLSQINLIRNIKIPEALELWQFRALSATIF